MRDWWEIYVYNINIISTVGKTSPFIIQENKHEGTLFGESRSPLKKKIRGDRQPPSYDIYSRPSNEMIENIAVSARKLRRKYDNSVSR